jgi:putative acetyltransferase
MIPIRRAGMQDLPTIRLLFTEYASELALDLGFQGFEEELQDLPGLYTPPGGELLLALKGPLPAGCVAMRPLGSHTCEMKRLYVRPAYRKTGVGKELVAAIIEAGRKAGYSLMRLDTLSSMKAARSLYRSFGFEPIEAYYHNPLEGAVYMELDLLEGKRP